MTAHVRDVLDRYYTVDALARACVGALDIPAPRLVVEPSVGGGAFARAVHARWPTALVYGVDVDPEAPGLADCDGGDTMSWTGIANDDLGAVVDLVVGNPPYRDAEEHVRHALEAAPVVGMLLRLGFLAGQKRRAFWDAHPPAVVHVITRRPSFTVDGKTDGSEYGFYVWDNRGRKVSLPLAPPRLAWLDWSPDVTP